LNKERKRTKKKETKGRGACGNCRSRANQPRWPAAIFFLMIYSAAWKTLLGFPQLLTSPAAAIDLNH
jgi:hypothetical protein